MKNCKKSFNTSMNKSFGFYSLPQLVQDGYKQINHLPYSLRVILESILRNIDGTNITEEHAKKLINWEPNAVRTEEVPFTVSRVILQDYTGVPLLADLAMMRDTAKSLGKNPAIVEPLVPVHLVIDHSVQTNFTGRPDALKMNIEAEFSRNKERYSFMKWGAQAFDSFKIMPPSMGIVHQINLENIATGVMFNKENMCYPDTVVGTDSHTTMINGLGVVGWGVGGIEAESAMLGQPIYILMPDVVGFKLTGKLSAGVTTTDLVLEITNILRSVGVVDKIVEYFGEGAASLSVPDRATIANMAPDYGATMGFFAVDEKTIQYYSQTGRSAEQVAAIEGYYKAQELFGVPANDTAIKYSKLLELDLNKVRPCVSGPKRPQDKILLENVSKKFTELLTTTVKNGGYKEHEDSSPMYHMQEKNEIATNGYGLDHCTRDGDKTVCGDEVIYKEYQVANSNDTIKNGDIVIAGITSCTNTSNPSVLIAAGLLARNAVKAGLKINARIKTSLAPGSKVVTRYLQDAGLLPYMEQIGFGVVAYGCTTCIGNVGDLEPNLEQAINDNNIVAAAVLSGNRNFEARIHPSVKANFLMSPPLVVAFALHGNVNIDMTKDPIGVGNDGQAVYLKEIWPSDDEIAQFVTKYAYNPAIYKQVYFNGDQSNPIWEELPYSKAPNMEWDLKSTYVARPPFFDHFTMEPKKVRSIENNKILALLGDSITTDHISPAGSIKATSPAGKYLIEHGFEPKDFNSYGARRGHHEVMMRGTFANTRLKNFMSDKEGGYTIYHGNGEGKGENMSIYDAAMKYQMSGIDTVIFAGSEYGTGSSRDWAAKGTYLLGVRAVIAKSFERIHRSNLVGMGVLPCQFEEKDSISSLNLTGNETVSFVNFEDLGVKARMTVRIVYADESVREINVVARLDTEIELQYYHQGGILPFIFRNLLS
jgi:aconitate hydratase